MKTILLKKTSTLIAVAFILLFFFSSCEKSSEKAASTQPVAPFPLEFVNFTIDNIDSSYTIPADSIIFHGRDSVENTTFNNNVLDVVAIHRQAGDSNFVAIHFNKIGIAQGSSQPLQMILQTHYKGSWPASPINVNITEYGAIPGEFIAGNFSGQVTDMTGANHTVSCSFRARRDY